MSLTLVDPDLEHISDPKMIAKIMGKRRAEAERKARFYAVKTRLIGVDKDYLSQQIAAKDASKQQEKEEEAEYATRANLYDQVAMLTEVQRDKAQKQLAAECKQFSSAFLRKEYRREFHLSDPNCLKNETNPDRDNAGPASMLKFRGEQIAIDKQNNRKMYEELQKTWIMEQVEERACREAEEKAMSQAYDENLLGVNALRGAIEVEAEVARREAKKEEAQANLELIEQKKLRKEKAKENSNYWESTHVDSVMNSEMLQEGAKAGYKGVGAVEKQAIYDWNALQMLEKKRMEQAEKEETLWYDQQRLASSAVMSTIEVQKMEVEKERHRLLNQENDLIAKAQNDMRSQLKTTYSNQVTDDYFNKFNSTAR